MGKIDFVIAWVDGSDPAWRREFYRYRRIDGMADTAHEVAVSDANTYATATSVHDDSADASDERYRDWGTLRYWFRAVEKFAPWVNRIHLLTWGHLPHWLDTSNPKLNIVRHEEFIPNEYLPTFNSCPIELNMHRIPGLSEQFVYFNDDMFLCRPVQPERFFRDGLPCDYARLALIPNERIGHNVLECMTFLNRRHKKKSVISHNIGKWFNRRYQLSEMAKSFMLLPWSDFTGLKETHMPQPYLKDTFIKLWSEESELLDATCRNRFRLPTDLSQWVFRHEQLAAGLFAPTGIDDTQLLKLSDDRTEMKRICDAIAGGHYSMVCINDNNDLTDMDYARHLLHDTFNKILPEQSSYEK